jgi:hypothetical protein
MKPPYTKHIKRRFTEKFKDVRACVSNDLTFLRDIDVIEISNIALNTDGYLARKGNKNTIKKVIFFNGISMWTVIDPNKNIVKTIYPVSKRDIKLLYKITK